MHWEEKYGSDPSEWLKVLDEHAVDRAFLMGHTTLHHAGLCHAGNNVVAETAKRAPDRLIPIGSAWPQMGEAGLEEVVRCISDLGMKGLKFHPWLQGFSTADSVFGEMCVLAGQLNVPVIFHDGTPCYSLSEQIAGVARRFPETRFVLGHSGILWNWRSALEAAQLPNIWLCLCGPHLRAMEKICREAPPERLLWGTDFGFGFLDCIEYRLGMMYRANIEPSLRERILGENPHNLLGGV